MRFTLVCALVLFSLIACQKPGDTVTNRTTERRCSADGLCLEAIGTHSLEGGYRLGDEEIRFDVAYAPLTDKSSPQNFSIRMLDQTGRQFFISHNGRSPRIWHKNKPNVVVITTPAAESRAQLIRCHEMLQMMSKSIKKRGNAQDIGRNEAFQLMREVLQEEVESNERIKRGGPAFLPQHPESPNEPFGINTEHQLLNQYHAVIEVPADQVVQRPFDQHDFLEGVLHFRDGVHRPVRNAGYFEQLIEERSYAFTGMQIYGDDADLSERVLDGGREFRQEIFLYKKPAPIFMAFGPFVGAEHSASAIAVFDRSRNTSEPWIARDKALTRNHGTLAEASTMRDYAACRNFPVTQGAYSWKGDCGDRWGTTHLCNDDTAYQIWHAYGNWNGGTTCFGRKRLFAPPCDRPWENSPSSTIKASVDGSRGSHAHASIGNP